MSQLTVLIIRHAEKPEGSWPGPGLTDQGKEDSKSLVIRGWQRAGAWAALFGTSQSSPDYPTPAKIYAATPGSVDDGPSCRPLETVTPLAARLGLQVNTRFAQGDELALVNGIVADSGVILVCWEHKAIVEAILPAFPWQEGTPLTHWAGERFDVVLRLDRLSLGEKFAFCQLMPCLLSGDSRSPMA